MNRKIENHSIKQVIHETTSYHRYVIIKQQYPTNHSLTVKTK